MDDRTGVLETPDGTVLHTRQWTEADPRFTLLIVHGIAEHSGRWEHVARFFASRGADVVSFDLRGHGRSEGDRCHVDRFDIFVDDVAFVVGKDVLPKARPWVLYGHSLGGTIATSYLTGERPHPDAAVLSSPSLGASAPIHLRVAVETLGRVLPKMRLPIPIDGAHLSRDETVAEEYFGDPLVARRGSARLGLELFRAEQAANAALGNLSVPTLVIHGADDEIVPPEASAPVAAVAGVDRKLYPGLRHEMHNEPDAEKVLRDVYAWLVAVLPDIAA